MLKVIKNQSDILKNAQVTHRRQEKRKRWKTERNKNNKQVIWKT